MLSEMNQERYKALRLLADHIRTPSRDLSLNAIFNDVKDEDLKWVTEKIVSFESSQVGIRNSLVPVGSKVLATSEQATQQEKQAKQNQGKRLNQSVDLTKDVKAMRAVMMGNLFCQAFVN